MVGGGKTGTSHSVGAQGTIQGVLCDPLPAMTLTNFTRWYSAARVQFRDLVGLLGVLFTGEFQGCMGPKSSSYSRSNEDGN